MKTIKDAIERYPVPGISMWVHTKLIGFPTKYGVYPRPVLWYISILGPLVLTLGPWANRTTLIVALALFFSFLLLNIIGKLTMDVIHMRRANYCDYEYMEDYWIDYCEHIVSELENEERNEQS